MRFHRSSSFIDSTVAVHPLAAHLYIRLIGAPRTANGFGVCTPALCKLGRIADYPPQNRAWGNQHSQFTHDLSQVSIAEFESEIPANTKDDDIICEPAFCK